MKEYRLALIGYGNVGQGLTQIIRDQGDNLGANFGVNIRIVAVSDPLKGSLYEPGGLDPDELLRAVSGEGSLEMVVASYYGWDALKTIKETNTDVVAEMSYTDLETGEPAISHVSAALKAGKHVITTNKGPAALKYADLIRIAAENGVELGVEGTVMSGTPTVLLGLDLLSAAGINKVQGILNGTTNYILTQMGAGATYLDALAEAQKLGYAEADPTGDVEGFDAAGKVVILANLLMNAPIGMNDVDRQGISRLTPENIAEAQAAGEKWKLIGAVEKTDGAVKASVRPVRLPISHPLASVDNATNAITFTTGLLGDITLIGPGAGRVETGYSLILDLLAIHRKHGE
jgi:homoserine dehydrogenase